MKENIKEFLMEPTEVIYIVMVGDEDEAREVLDDTEMLSTLFYGAFKTEEAALKWMTENADNYGPMSVMGMMVKS